MQDFTDFLNVALGLATVVFGGVAGLMFSTQKVLREANSDYKARNEQLEAQIREQAVELAQVKADLSALGRVVTGEVHWKALAETLDQHHAEAAEHWQTDERLLAQILNRLGEATP